MPAAPKPPDELRELAGLELDRRRLVRELLTVEVAIDKLQCQIRDRGVEIPWIKKGIDENPISRCQNRAMDSTT